MAVQQNDFEESPPTFKKNSFKSQGFRINVRPPLKPHKETPSYPQRRSSMTDESSASPPTKLPPINERQRAFFAARRLKYEDSKDYSPGIRQQPSQQSEEDFLGAYISADIPKRSSHHEARSQLEEIKGGKQRHKNESFSQEKPRKLLPMETKAASLRLGAKKAITEDIGAY